MVSVSPSAADPRADSLAVHTATGVAFAPLVTEGCRPPREVRRQSLCAVIEDSPVGVVAGVAAGMTVYGYCAFTPERRLLEAGAHHTFNNMTRLPRLLFGR